MSTHSATIGGVRLSPPWTAVSQRMPFRRVGFRSWRSFIGHCLVSMSTPVWMAADLLIVLVGAVVGQWAFVWWHPQTNLLVNYPLWIVIIPLGCSVVLAGMMFGLYERHTLWRRGRILTRTALTILFAMLATYVVVHVFLYAEISRRMAAFAIVFYVAVATGLRLTVHGSVRHARRGLVLIGHGPTTSLLLRAIHHKRLPGYRLYGIVSDDPSRHGGDIRGTPVLGGIEHLPDVIERYDIHEVVVADHVQRHTAYQQAALLCLRLGCRVTNETTFYETAFAEVPVAHITPRWFFFADLRGQREEHAAMKRVFDICTALIGLALTFPLWPLIALLVRIQDGGPVFYAQKRVGQGGKPFTLLKFRTMATNAERAGAVWAAEHDPRVTRIGRFLRKTRLDELPQIWNVLQGDMAMVGPRPERPDIVEGLSKLIPYYQERHLIKPGLTGWAQICYRYGASVADARRKLQYDLYYIKHMSLELDLIILLRTFGTLLLGAR
ncbi:MAG: sugar transferase [Phycisphaerae bacterium]